ncbi:uncharacterized protein LOC130747340 [Lotus japonicus]|uniref:uncharacterized protein LOC130747340 n=1 Tax=Lotus japonicus TaxID=34305 RepID=UPI00258B3ED7|nr:uncharacterized protein LOC130747340 [Lotus japonicus]
MEKFLVPPKPSINRVQSLRRSRWKRCLGELNGRFEPNYRHEMMDFLSRSYSQVGVFPHLYGANETPCENNMNRFVVRKGISAVDFDNKGIYLVSVTKSGCLTVHDFEALYCRSHDRTGSKEDESMRLLHLPLNLQLDAVKWNLHNQDEVVCASIKHQGLLIFDVASYSSEPTEVLKTRHRPTVDGYSILKGFSDVAFAPNDSRIFASDTRGTINVWDKRGKILPCLEFTSASHDILNSIQLSADNQIIFGAGNKGLLHVWDIRGGRVSTNFQSHKELCYPPLTSVKLATLLEKIGSLKAQTKIISKEIHSIAINPSCPYQLAFHLDDGWSGILDINNFQVTHIHCPPPPWLNDSYVPTDVSYLRKPSWLSTCSIYMTGSPCNSGIHLLDFYPSTSSPSHVDYRENIEEFNGQNKQNNRNRFISLSEEVISCAAHPLYNAIVAGTKESSLLVISQRRESSDGKE